MATNKFRVSLAQRANEEGYPSKTTYLNAECNDSVVVALCTEYCEVEPDGECSHGCPSPLVAAGII